MKENRLARIVLAAALGAAGVKELMNFGSPRGVDANGPCATPTAVDPDRATPTAVSPQGQDYSLYLPLLINGEDCDIDPTLPAPNPPTLTLAVPNPPTPTLAPPNN